MKKNDPKLISKEEYDALLNQEQGEGLPSLRDLAPTPDTSGETEIMTTDEALAKITMHLAKPPNIKTMTETNLREIILISQLYVIGKRTENDMLLNFVDTYLELKVSNRREGRKELIDMGKAGRNFEAEKGKFSRFLGGFR